MQYPKLYPKNVLSGKETITNSKLNLENFNNSFIEIGPTLCSEIKTPAKKFEVYLKNVDILQPEYSLCKRV